MINNFSLQRYIFFLYPQTSFPRRRESPNHFSPVEYFHRYPPRVSPASLPLQSTNQKEHKIYLQSIRTGLDNTRNQLHELIRLLEKKNAYTVYELYALYVSKSFGGLFPYFTDYVMNNRKGDNRLKTAKNCMTAKLSFEHFLSGRDVLLELPDA